MVIELPSHLEQAEFNLRRWDEVLADSRMSRIEWRFETDRYGHVIIMPPSIPRHGIFQLKIGSLLTTLLPNGTALTECPVSTADGVNGADVAWASPTRMAQLGNRSCFPQAPDICVEVASADNSDAELREKLALYLDAGATEVWLCSQEGAMSFFGKGLSPLGLSQLCPAFPRALSAG